MPPTSISKADPIELNSRLCTYTNFVNLLDLAGISIPCTVAANGTSHGVTFLGPAGHDADLASLGAAFHSRTQLPLGALQSGMATMPPVTSTALTGEVEIAVVGAHLTGMPLNHELTSLRARFLHATTTALDYRLFALPNATPPKPGLLRVPAGTGSAIAVETWALSHEGFGRFVQGVPAPLSIGTLRLSDGGSVKGFLVEPEGWSAREMRLRSAAGALLSPRSERPMSGNTHIATHIAPASNPVVNLTASDGGAPELCCRATSRGRAACAPIKSTS